MVCLEPCRWRPWPDREASEVAEQDPRKNFGQDVGQVLDPNGWRADLASLGRQAAAVPGAFRRETA
jgi:hypothetical protein